MNKNKRRAVLLLFLAAALIFTSCSSPAENPPGASASPTAPAFDYGGLFTRTLSSDGADAEALAAELADAFYEDPAAFIKALSSYDDKTQEKAADLAMYGLEAVCADAEVNYILYGLRGNPDLSPKTTAYLHSALRVQKDYGGDDPEAVYAVTIQNFGFRMSFPKAFADRIFVSVNENENTGGSVNFVAKDIFEARGDEPGMASYGTLFRIEIFPKGEYDEKMLRELSDLYSLRILDENEMFYYGLAYPTDVQYPPDDEALAREYKELASHAEECAGTFALVETA